MFDSIFDSPFDFLSFAIAVVALVVARKAFNRVDELRSRLDAMRAFASAAAARPAAAPPPVPPQAENEQAPPLAAEPAGQAATTAPAAGPSTFDTMPSGPRSPLSHRLCLHPHRRLR